MFGFGMVRTAFIVLSSLLIFLAFENVGAQPLAPCGVVEAIGYPINNMESEFERRRDDFALFRTRFGGNHVGLDIAFDRRGDPVWASARGRVTYSDPEGWDTEKGVVIVEHVFPDGEIYYTLYGHVEETREVKLPEVGTCVERGGIVGTVGWPSRGAPHLHYEIRDFLPNDGGPGYVSGNPLDDGWLHPLDFTFKWQLRFQVGYVQDIDFKNIPTLPPILRDDGSIVLASGNRVEILSPEGQKLWGITTINRVIGLAALSGGRIAVWSYDGQVSILQDGRYLTVWSVPVLNEDAQTWFVALPDLLIFMVDNGPGAVVRAYDTNGVQQWSLDGAGEIIQVVPHSVSPTFALTSRVGANYLWRVVDASGQILHESASSLLPTIADLPGSGWLALSRQGLAKLSTAQNPEIVEVDSLPGRPAVLTADALGNTYAYSANTLFALDSNGRLRWRTAYPLEIPENPVLKVDDGCVLYTLDANGWLHAFNAHTGELVSERQLYAGGNRNSSPAGRLLWLDPAGLRLRAGAGFLSLVTFDTGILAYDARNGCILG